MNETTTIAQSTLELIKTTERYKTITIDFLGKKIKIIDSASFLSSYKEIFENQIFRFHAKHKQPFIIDCGANIGLSVLFFKQLYPHAHIIAFEPVPGIFEVLTYNLSQFGYGNIVFHNKAVWKEKTQIPFMNEGADSGRIAVEGDKEHIIEVETVRLKDFINKPVDFLKVDIEGAETKVVEDIVDTLDNVKNIFIEYHSFIERRQSIDVLLKILLDRGFRIHIHQGNVSKNPFITLNYRLGMDMQLNIFGFRG